MPNIGRKSPDLFDTMLDGILETLAPVMATWLPLISTDATLEVKEILEGYMVRFGIEEKFKDLKDVWGWGKQELSSVGR